MFHFRFRPPTAGGRHGRLIDSYTLSTTAPHRPGCASVVSKPVTVTRGGTTLTVSLGPGPGALWCPGRHSGRVLELARPVCRAGQACPQFIRVVAEFGPVTFHVTR